MTDGVEYTQEDYDVAFDGLITQMDAVELYWYLDDEPMTGFLHNTAKVIAYERAYSRALQNALHEMSFEEKV